MAFFRTMTFLPQLALFRTMKYLPKLALFRTLKYSLQLALFITLSFYYSWHFLEHNRSSLEKVLECMSVCNEVSVVGLAKVDSFFLGSKWNPCQLHSLHWQLPTCRSHLLYNSSFLHYYTIHELFTECFKILLYRNKT